MKLSAEDQKQVRLALLRYGMRLRGISASLATQYLREEGFSGIEREEVQAQFNYLAHPQKALMEIETDAVSPEVARYMTTPLGQDYLAKK